MRMKIMTAAIAALGLSFLAPGAFAGSVAQTGAAAVDNAAIADAIKGNAFELIRGGGGRGGGGGMRGGGGRGMHMGMRGGGRGGMRGSRMGFRGHGGRHVGRFGHNRRFVGGRWGHRRYWRNGRWWGGSSVGYWGGGGGGGSCFWNCRNAGYSSNYCRFNSASFC